MLLSAQPAFPALVHAHSATFQTQSKLDAAAAPAGRRPVSRIGHPQPASIRHEVACEAALAQAVEDAPQTTGALISYIQHRYYDSHRIDLTELICLTTQVQLHCGDNPHPSRMIMALLPAIDALLTAQRQQDDSVLFPLMMSAASPKMAPLIRRRVSEYGIFRDRLAELCGLAKGPAPCVAADPVWKALCFGTRDFADDVVAHLHLKETVLFPRFL